MVNWYRIKDAPRTGKPILCCFKGQFGWIYFVCDRANGENTQPPLGYAKPDYWTWIVEPDWEEEFIPRK